MKRENTKTPVYDAEYIESSSGPWRHKPRARYADTGWWLGLGIVACVSGMVALVMLVGGMW